jgi:hypothetical protein
VADLVERARPSVAFVLSTTDRGRASGTAFAVHPDGLLATALHVVDEAREVSVAFPGGPTLQADVVAADGDSDLAILRVQRTGGPSLRLADPQGIRQGEEVIVIGYRLADVLGSYDVTVTRGIVSAIRTNLGLVQVDAAMNPGVSGGPVLNGRGEASVRGIAGRHHHVSEDPPRQHRRRRARRAVRAATVRGACGDRGARAAQRARNTAGDRLVVAQAWGDDPGAFGHMGMDGRPSLFPAIPTRRTVSAMVELPPEPVCVNYLFRSDWICISCGFDVRYTLQYRMRAVPAN